MSYKELQVALKDLRSQGYDVQVKLNASKEVLQGEYDRLLRTASWFEVTTTTSAEADDFNNWVGFTQAVSCEVLETPQVYKRDLLSSSAKPSPYWLQSLAYKAFARQLERTFLNSPSCFASLRRLPESAVTSQQSCDNDLWHSSEPLVLVEMSSSDFNIWATCPQSPLEEPVAVFDKEPLLETTRKYFRPARDAASAL